MATHVKNARQACLLLLLPIVVLSLAAEARVFSQNDKKTGEEEFNILRKEADVNFPKLDSWNSTSDDVPLSVCGSACTATNVANKVAIQYRLTSTLTGMQALQKYYRCSVSLTCKYDLNAYNKIIAGVSIPATTIICYPGPKDSTATSCPSVFEEIAEN